jgi:hypothetical protein
VIERYLKIVGRCFDNESGLKIAFFHLGDPVSANIVKQGECMGAVCADEDVGTTRILAPEPAERRVYLFSAPTLSYSTCRFW